MMQLDWYPADIIAALKSGERRWRRFPVTPDWPTHLTAAGQGERLIAEALGVAREKIWASHYR